MTLHLWAAGFPMFIQGFYGKMFLQSRLLLLILISVLEKLKKEYILRQFSIYLNKYFKNKSSQGCLIVEKENGPDDYVDDLREDIFKRFKTLRELL